MVICDLRLSACGNRKQRRFPYIWESYQAYVSDQLHFQDHISFFGKSARFCKIRGLTRRGCILRIALAAFAALGCNERFPVFLQIFHHQSGFLVDHNRTDRHFYDQVFAILAITFFLHAILTVFGFVFSFITKIHQCAHIFICLKDDISAFAAVSAIRSAFWNKRFSSK